MVPRVRGVGIDVYKRQLQSFYAKIDPELNVPEDQRYFPDPADPDLIDNKIEELGGVDTILGGVGCKGLIGWNERPISNVHHITPVSYTHLRRSGRIRAFRSAPWV